MKQILKIVPIAAVLTLGNIQNLSADSYSLEDLIISNIWTRATPGRAKTAAVYIGRIQNTGQVADTLIGVSSPFADKNMIHKTFVEGGIAKMSHIKELEIRPGQLLSLKPSNLHIMMIGIQQPLTVGRTFPIILEFRKSGKIEVIVEVKKSGTPMKMRMDHKK